MEYKDLRCKHINATAEGHAIYVTFSTLHPYGLAKYFGENFFLKHGIEAFLITQNGKNQWWHTKELFDLANLIKKRSIETGKYIVLYGSSMGGYAACHFRSLFNSKYSIAIAPQIFVDRKVFSTEKRWGKHIDLMQEDIIFDELQSLSQQINQHLYVFYDSIHNADSAYVDFYHNYYISTSEVRFFDVPYTNHDVARALNKAKVLSKIVLSFNAPNLIIHQNDISELCSMAYQEDMRSFLNFFRKQRFSKDDECGNQYSFGKFDEYYSRVEDMDFASLYLLAESLLKLQRNEEAIEISLRSIEKYMITHKKPAPDYLRKKFQYIVHQSLSISG